MQWLAFQEEGRDGAPCGLVSRSGAGLCRVRVGREALSACADARGDRDDAPPAPEAWLTVTLDDSSRAPRDRKIRLAQTMTVRLEPAFFIDTLPCSAACDPASTFGVGVRRGIRTEPFARLLTVRDLTSGGAGREVAHRSDKPLPLFPSHRPPDGYHRLASDRRLRTTAGTSDVAASNRRLVGATDGQSLGYTWMAVVERRHERPYASWAGQVWEASNGHAGAVSGAQRVRGSPVPRADLAGRSDAATAGAAPRDSRDGARRSCVESAPRRHNRCGRRASDRSRHLLSLRVEPDWSMPRSRARSRSGRPTHAHDFRGIHQPNGTSGDQPRRVREGQPAVDARFVTRLDNAAPVSGARVTIVGSAEQPLRLARRHGMRMAWRSRPRCQLRPTANPSFLRSSSPRRRTAISLWVGSDWTQSARSRVGGLRYPARVDPAHAAWIGVHRSRRLQAGRCRSCEGRAARRHAVGACWWRRTPS